MIAKIEQMMAETRSLLDGQKAQQSMIYVWIEMLVAAMDQVKTHRLSRGVKITPSAAEATLIFDEFVQEESNQDEGGCEPQAVTRAPEPVYDVAEATEVFDAFVASEMVRDEGTPAVLEASSPSSPLATNDGPGEKPPAQDQAGSLDGLPLSQAPTPVSSAPAPPSRGNNRTGMTSRGAPSFATDRGILRSRGWSKLVSSIAHSPGGIPAAGSGGSRGGQGSSLEVPRTPEDFDQLLKDAGLNMD